jgi:hypothetical protein
MVTHRQNHSVFASVEQEVPSVKVFGGNSAICAARAFATTLGQSRVRRDLVFRVYAVENSH